jgi:glycosidase
MHPFQDVNIIMEFDINHCSDQHPWFKNSTTKAGNYTDYFVWKDAKAERSSDGKPQPPNNWVNLNNRI